MKSMPRLKVEAQNPPRSQGMPPPTLMRIDLRLAPCELRNSHICTAA